MDKQMPDLMAAGQPAQADTSQLSVVGPTSRHLLLPFITPPPAGLFRPVQDSTPIRTTSAPWRLPRRGMSVQRDDLKATLALLRLPRRGMRMQR